MRDRLSLLLAATAIAAAPAAYAQAGGPPDAKPAAAKPAAKAPAAPAKPAAKTASKTVETITVTGESQNAYRSSIDRKSYGIANDLAATTGSISDALKNVPSVEVDVQGNVSLRGDPNVTIMVDGKPSTLFKGPGGAQALQSLPADQFERVEVITNPSAQFSPEGSAGIINLISKQTRRAGRSGSVRANVGTAGRRNFGTSLAYNAPKLTLTGDAGWRHDPQHSVGHDEYAATDPATGRTVTTTNDNDIRGPLDSWNLRLGADYDPDPATRVSGELRYNNTTFHQLGVNHDLSVDSSGATLQAFDAVGPRRSDRDNMGLGVNLRRNFAGDDHLLTVSLDREHTDERNDNTQETTTFAPAASTQFRNARGRNGFEQTQLKADYSRPMAAEGRLKAGYYFRLEDNGYDNLGTLGASRATAGDDPHQTNDFHYRLQLNAAYLTYEQPFGDWTVLGGLRLEDARLDLEQETTHQANRQAYTRLYPSLHLADRLSETQQLTLSYSERISRPGPGDLNPFRFVGLTSAREGNPNLKPQITHAFEAGWQLKENGTFYLATLYYRINDRGVTDIETDLGGGVILQTKANLSRSRNAGLELVANGHLTKSLSYNVSTNLYWNEIDATRIPIGPGLGFGGTRSAFTVGGRASLNWQATPDDVFQVNVQENAKRLLPQGFQEPMTLVFLGYRHKVSDSLSAVVTVQDPFDSYQFRETIDTPVLKERIIGRGRIQAAFFGLTYSFGAAQKRQPQTFDFGQGPGG